MWIVSAYIELCFGFINFHKCLGFGDIEWVCQVVLNQAFFSYAKDWSDRVGANADIKLTSPSIEDLAHHC